MPYDEIEVRITREGHIYVDTRGMTPERVRSVMEYIRETVGPVKIVTEPDDHPPQRINLSERVIDEQAEKDRENRERSRLRNRQ
jgi:hypothetical protein